MCAQPATVWVSPSYRRSTFWSWGTPGRRGAACCRTSRSCSPAAGAASPGRRRGGVGAASVRDRASLRLRTIPATWRSSTTTVVNCCARRVVSWCHESARTAETVACNRATVAWARCHRFDAVRLRLVAGSYGPILRAARRWALPSFFRAALNGAGLGTFSPVDSTARCLIPASTPRTRPAFGACAGRPTVRLTATWNEQNHLPAVSGTVAGRIVAGPAGTPASDPPRPPGGGPGRRVVPAPRRPAAACGCTRTGPHRCCGAGHRPARRWGRGRTGTPARSSRPAARTASRKVLGGGGGHAAAGPVRRGPAAVQPGAETGEDLRDVPHEVVVHPGWLGWIDHQQPAPLHSPHGQRGQRRLKVPGTEPREPIP